MEMVGVKELARGFALVFKGRVDAWGSVTGRCNYEPITMAHFERHLAGQVPFGQYPLLSDGTCYWTAGDFDQDTPANWHNGPDDDTPGQYLIDALAYFGANQGLYLEKTKQKGFRVWQFYSAPVLARDTRRLFYAALDKAGLPRSVEVFPKQAFTGNPIPGNPHPVGNYVNLPYFGGGPSGPRKGRVFIDLHTLFPIPLEQMLACHQTLDSNAMSLIMDNLPKEQPQRAGHKPMEIVEMLSKPLAVGERRPTLIKLAGYLLSHDVPEDIAVAVLLPWAEKCFVKSLTPQEIEKHIRGIYTRYGTNKNQELEPRGGVSLDFKATC